MLETIDTTEYSPKPTAEELYREYALQIFKYLHRFVKTNEEAEDLMQETFYRACKGLPKLQGPLKVSSWLYHIATHVAYDDLRRRRIVTYQSLDVWEEEREAAYPSATIDDPAEQVGEAACIQAALACLTEGYRRALLLHVYAGYNGEQIAQTVGIAPSGGKMYLSRARRRFRQHYEEENVC
jgi:RNA polymerase sigma-70 factor (ECF subfamily)